jgi:hypothetical protein
MDWIAYTHNSWQANRVRANRKTGGREMTNAWRTDNRKTTYLDAGKYIAVRISDHTIKFFPWPKFSAAKIREHLAKN